VTEATLSAADLDQLAAAGISPAEAERQLELLRNPPPPAHLERPATVGDGIERLSAARQEALVELGRDAQRRGRVGKFVPASGAASRMFRALEAARRRLSAATLAELRAAGEAGDPDAAEAARFVAVLPRLALGDAWAGRLGTPLDALVAGLESGPLARHLDSLLDATGLGAATAPKALLPFHRAPEGPRSPLVEHVLEGAEYLRDAEGVVRLAFTTPPGAAAHFRAELERAAERLAGVRLELGLSEQSRSTDTLALDDRGRPLRAADGRLVLRPAGHGALLPNLEATAGDLVAIKNIDNILPAGRHPEIGRWKAILIGRLVELEAERPTGERPRRVVGVVPNTGEPGGGPFWLRRSDGSSSLQIVEGSQVDRADRSQTEVWGASTHFNPVDLVVALRGRGGEPFRLADFVDPAAAFVSTKSEAGHDVTVLERPGLWNGAMAGWESHFVEVPGWTFAPVKTVLDLARDEHLG